MKERRRLFSVFLCCHIFFGLWGLLIFFGVWRTAAISKSSAKLLESCLGRQMERGVGTRGGRGEGFVRTDHLQLFSLFGLNLLLKKV